MVLAKFSQHRTAYVIRELFLSLIESRDLTFFLTGKVKVMIISIDVHFIIHRNGHFDLC